MLEYLKYLKENFGKDFDKVLSEDMALSMAIYDCEEEDEDEITVYDLIDGYLELCNDVRDDYQSLFNEMDSAIQDHDDNQVSILLKSMKIANVSEKNEGYVFTLSAERPIQFTIDLFIKDISHDNVIKREDNELIKSDEEEYNRYPYILSYDKDDFDIRSVVMAGIFNEWVDLDNLYDLIKKMSLINKKLIYTPHASTTLPITLELSEMGKVELFDSSGNDRDLMMRICLDKNEFSIPAYRHRESSDIIYNFCHAYSKINDPIWVLNNMLVYSRDVHKMLRDECEYTLDNLEELFKKNGYATSLSYKEMNCSCGEERYFTYGERNELFEITDYDSAEEMDEVYRFVFNDGSTVKIPKDKVVVLEYSEYVNNEIEAAKKCNLKMGY